MNFFSLRPKNGKELILDILSLKVKISLSLSKGELCVCDIAHVLGLSISAVSHQLRLLRSLGLVKYRSDGRRAFYILDNEHVMRLIYEGIRHIEKV